MLIEERIFTPSEAAVVSGVPLKTVHREIDEGPLKPARKRSRSRRTLREEDLFYLAVAKGLDTRLVQLTSEGKGKLHDAIVMYCRKRGPAKREFPLFGGGLSLDLKRVLEEVRSRVERLERARRLVVEEPEIRGGEPCIRGTRIGVYEVSSMLEQDTSEEEILEGFPSLKREQLELAKIFAQAYPRKGRPPRHPWHQTPWREISRSETRR
ncbi:MAG: DUF433 domain-containing protein [Candidatus Binataceae bacterium]|nr:DUF433 domain-containing protein [Candidatus Binataceae bacterium]